MPKPQFRNVTGQRFGRLTAQWPAGRGVRYQVHWLCLCDCGGIKVVPINSLIHDDTRSCGCLRGHSNLRHGHTSSRGNSREDTSWLSMRSRCYYARDKCFSLYGAKGVTVCRHWRNSFENFLADMGPRPKETTIGRFKDSGNYEPGNCAWMSSTEQAADRRNLRTPEDKRRYHREYQRTLRAKQKTPLISE